MDRFLKEGKLRPEVASDLPVEEKELAQNYNGDSLKHYLGKKAVSRLGCYACHDIPGFDTAKPIGVALNDWGKKDPSRLAFEDIKSYLEHHYQVVPSLVGKDGKPVQPKKEEGAWPRSPKMPYEKFYADALVHNHRDGYLNQKILDPRSYDYNRLRAWDDRSRMPQFRFARSHKKDKESAEDFKARANVEEAEAREAVATFILGLVAEPVPTASVNQPKGDRLAEVKGRQILDKYNCGGCHLVRPGSFDFKVTEDSLKNLESALWQVRKTRQSGRRSLLPLPFRLGGEKSGRSGSPCRPGRPRQGARVDEDDPNIKSAEIRLTRALRFQGADKQMKDIESASVLAAQAARHALSAARRLGDQGNTVGFSQGQGPLRRHLRRPAGRLSGPKGQEQSDAAVHARTAPTATAARPALPCRPFCWARANAPSPSGFTSSCSIRNRSEKWSCCACPSST